MMEDWCVDEGENFFVCVFGFPPKIYIYMNIYYRYVFHNKTSLALNPFPILLDSQGSFSGPIYLATQRELPHIYIPQTKEARLGWGSKAQHGDWRHFQGTSKVKLETFVHPSTPHFPLPTLIPHPHLSS